MRYPGFLKSKWLVGIPLLAVLGLAAACGDDATPVVIEKEVIVEKEVPVEVVVEKEVPVEVVVEKEVIKEVVKEVVVVATPTPGPVAMVKEQQYYGGVVPMSSVGDVRGWDPHKHGRAEDIHANGLAYNQLVEYNPLNAPEVICDLCDDWEVGSDFLVYTFNIHKGVKFQDGEDLDADDVVFSVNRMIHEGISKTGLFRPYVRDENPVEKVDSHTLKITLKQPSGAFLQFLAIDFNKVLPQHVASVEDMELYENYGGSGPWVTVNWEEGVSYEWEANPNYFKRTAKGYPFFGGIQGFQIADVGTEIAALKTERILMPMDLGGQLSIEDHKRLSQDEDFTSRFDLYWLKGTAHQGIIINGSRAPFDKPEVRRALFLAVDRWEFLEGLGQGEWPLGAAMGQKNPYALPLDEVKALPGYRRNADGSKPQEDIDEAIRLLNSVGFNADNPLKMEIVGGKHSWLNDGAVLMKEQLKKFGLPVEATVKSLEIGAAVGAAIEGDYDINVIGCGMSVFDPDDSFFLCYMPTGRNWSRVTEPGVEELFFAQQVEPDPIKRRDINYEMQRLVYAGAPGTIEIQNSAFGNWIHKRIRTENGPWQQRHSTYSHLKMEHMWLIPKDVWEAQR